MSKGAKIRNRYNQVPHLTQDKSLFLDGTKIKLCATIDICLCLPSCLEHLLKSCKVNQLGDNCIQKFNLGRYIVGYTVGNLVLRRRVNGAVKRDFRTYIRRYTAPNENFEYGYPHSNALLTFSLQKDSKMYCVAPIRPAAASCIKPLASCIYSLVHQ